jgi:RHS repeat-associated protein
MEDNLLRGGVLCASVRMKKWGQRTILLYNAAGNRTQIGGTWARTGLPQAVSSATYNAANQLTSWAGTTLTYDANGNLTNDGAKSYTWDARNRMSAMTGASFVYDPLGRRVSKTVGASTTNYLYDGQNPVQEGGANLLTGLGIDEYLTRTDSGGARSFLTDALGSTLALTDTTGTVQTSYTYEPFGKTTTTGTASTNPFQYTGRENDGTGLSYYRARYYSSTLQRFISEDPIGFFGGDTNLYAYVGNNPLKFIDPTGLTFQSNWDFFWDWTLGSEPRQRTYGPNDIETQEMRDSPGAASLRNEFYEGGCKSMTGGNYGTGQAYVDTAANPFTADWTSTAFQVGGFTGGSVTNNGNGTATFNIPNRAGTHSFFFHAVPNRSSPIGPMSTIDQTFQWTEPIGGRKDGCR